MFNNELCGNEMSRDHDAPVEYLRKLASLKLRFGLAALATALELSLSVPQWLSGILTYPMVALVVKLSQWKQRAV